LVVNQVSGCVAPISDFSASQQAGFASFTVTFSDISTNAPIQWEWSLSGGDPATSTAQNPTVTYAIGGLFDVTLKAINNCGTDTITKTNYINVIGTVGIDNLATSEIINIYPNPNKGTFNISAEINTSNIVELKLFSAIGQLIYSSKIQPVANKIDKEISVNNLAASVYIIQLVIDKKPLYKKLIIE
jgi:PKD repeat protein